MNQITIAKATMSVFVNDYGNMGLPITIPENVASLYWFNNTNGWIEAMDGTQTPITSFPEWAQKCVDVYNENLPNPDPCPAPQEMNRLAASNGLYETDWTSIPDITDPKKCTPYLTNQQDFLDYRNQLRAIALNPPAMSVQMPTKPKPKWST